jgi:putative hemolysin
MVLEIAVILVLVLINGVFAGTEAAMIAARRGRLQQSADAGDQNAAAALSLQEDPNLFLSTIQVGITLIGILAGAFGGASISARLQGPLQQIPFIGEAYASTIAFVLVIVIITYLSLVLGELLPKRLALQSSEALATRMARPMLMLSKLGSPIVAILTWSTNSLLTLLGRRNVADEQITEEDIRHMVREGAEGGIVEPQEHLIIERLFNFSDRAVRQIMTYRMDLYALDADEPLNTVLAGLIESGFSRFPVYEKNTDNIVGIAHVRDLLRIYRTAGDAALVRTVMHPPLYVPENMRAVELLATFRKNRRHLALVVSELGSVEGIVTLEDVLEEIVGEIVDESDDIEDEGEMVIQREDGSLLIEGVLPIDKLKIYLSVTELPDEKTYRFDTLAGFLLSLFGQIPKAGDIVHWGGWRFEVVDMDGLRIDKVLVMKEKPMPEEQDNAKHYDTEVHKR